MGWNPDEWPEEAMIYLAFTLFLKISAAVVAACIAWRFI